MAKPDPTAGRRPGRPIRCAIYTRKSSEEGLEQDFNSLHAQREACEAYIRSQRHEGWVLLCEQYDDGGISGATMDRPALQQLLADIAARKVDTVVVYKVDRLTRTLADFAKIVEIFDGHEVAFVSVTQQFNTTTSMGRLTLNVLLSFAQFEREVTGERIRDKIAASKKKGMWMGGTPPLGYDARDRKLIVHAAEAETVRHIFRRYAALRSVRLLKQELDAAGIVSKDRVSAAGRRWGGRPLARGALYRMLQNRVYRGEIAHKDQHYPAEHPPIVDQELWDRVQAVLTANAIDRKAGHTAKNPSLLAGLIHDGAGNRMTPSHAVKDGKRYRYYVSRPLIAEGKAKASGTCRIPAAEIERVVADRVQAFLADGAAVFDAVRTIVTGTSDQKRLVEQAATIAQGWATLPPPRRRSFLRTPITRVEVTEDAVHVHLLPARVVVAIEGQSDATLLPPALHQDPIVLAVPVRLHRIGQGTRLIMNTARAAAAQPNAGLTRLLVQAHQMQRRLLQGKHRSIAEFANQEQMTGSYISRLVRLAWLAPDITQAILSAQHPPALTAIKLMQSGPLPLDWQEQRAVLGFV
ncbi:recombinase family protein [Limobrevibacterium gyesilva]|uniref:Recombinase family protein n=1 Tax=Limobrevibacterium gyesilva TaxID=2991712 RepID=A0AA41YMT8_9PROT|nr:recombinase family protein [Limobrevibacterium gyesilva]MCW3474913.1 recombinase family protein [Limobrevibacterium gyesilva]